MKEVLVLTHVEWEGPGTLGQRLADAGLQVCMTQIVDNPSPSLPRLTDLAGVVIMGGPMAADDITRYPGLAAEQALAREAALSGVPLLGVCLGHQIVALALGATLRLAAADEVGLGAVEVLEDSVLGRAGESVPVVHWHHDVVSLPEGARRLARTSQTENQAFTWADHVFAAQFHLEADRAQLQRWLEVPAMRTDLSDRAAAGLLTGYQDLEWQLERTASTFFGGFIDAAVRR